MSEPHWKKRRRLAMEQKQNPSFYGKQAVKRFDDIAEGSSFWGHRGLQRRFGRVDGKRIKPD